MHGSAITAIFLPFALGIIMLGLGLSLTIGDFRRVIAYPRAILVGLLCQALLLPLICFAIAKGFAMPPELAVGLMLLAASPGGATANLFSHLAKGDVALNITLTATNSVLSLLTLPLIVSASLAHFMAEGRAIPLQSDKIVQVFAVVLVPVAIGMLVRAKKQATARRLEKPVRILSAFFLLLIIAAALAKDGKNLTAALTACGLPVICFNLTSLGVGYFVPRLLRLPERQSIAIGMEIGIHNGTLAIAIATTVLGRDAMALPPAIYSIVMFFTAAVFGALVQRRGAPRPVASDVVA